MKNEELIRRFRIERKKFDRSGIYAYTSGRWLTTPIRSKAPH